MAFSLHSLRPWRASPVKLIVRCNMTTAALLLNIRQAFAEVLRPTRTMADAEVEDDRSEASRFAEHDAHWWEIPHELIERCSAPFCFLSPADMVYYLPAYMSWFLSTEGGPNSFSSESVIYYLSDSERGRHIASLLDQHQRTAVIAFLEYVKVSPNLCCFQEDVKSALITIWRNTEPDPGHDDPKAGRGSA